MQGVHLRKYGVATNINFELYEIDGVDFRVDGAHEAGDTKIMKDNGAEANTGSGFVDEGNGYSLALTSTEMEAARIVIYVIDQTATKAWLDKSIIIETYGNASAQHAFDLDTTAATMRGTDNANTVVPDASGVASGLISALNDFDPVNDDVAVVTSVGTCTSNSDMRGTDGANIVIPDVAGTAPTVTQITADIDANSTRLDADITSRAPANEYDTELDAVISSRAPASEYDTEMARITADVATEAKQDIMQIDVDLIEALSKNKRILDVANSKWLLYDIAGTSVILTWPALDKNGDPIAVDAGVPTQTGVPY